MMKAQAGRQLALFWMTAPALTPQKASPIAMS